ncbi:hypothetical protein DMENIID0001_163130 [Sergentomyia squamirostris]
MPSGELSDPPNGVTSRDEHSEVSNSTRYPPHENLRIIKNVIILGFAFMVHFTAFHGTSNLQSSVNTDASLGTFTLAAIYGSLILSNIFLPAAVIRCAHAGVTQGCWRHTPDNAPKRSILFLCLIVQNDPSLASARVNSTCSGDFQPSACADNCGRPHPLIQLHSIRSCKKRV